MALRAVVFDLWNTIAVWPEDVWAETRPQVAEHLGLTVEEFESRWYGELAHLRETGRALWRYRVELHDAALAALGKVPGTVPGTGR